MDKNLNNKKTKGKRGSRGRPVIRLRKQPRGLLMPKTNFIDDFKRAGDDAIIKLPTDLRKETLPNMLRKAKAYREHMRDRYLIGLVHPDLAVRYGLAPKLYSDMPIPSTTMGYHFTQAYNTNASGNLLFSFRAPFPTYSNVGPCSYVTVNNHATLNGTTVVGNNNFIECSPVYNGVYFQRYRLVSALFRVTYNGPMLNLAGRFHSCAVFDSFGICVGPNITIADPAVDRYTNFPVITNGLWNLTKNIIADDHSIECLWIPTDGQDYFFNRTGTYYGTTIAANNTMYNPDPKGAHMNFLIAVEGAPAATSFTVETFVNYEVIADPTGAPFMNQNADAVWTADDKTVVNRVIQDELKTNGLIRGGTQTSSSGNFLDVMSGIIDSGLPLLKRLISLF